LDHLAFEPAAFVFGVLELCPVDQRVQADFDVPRDLCDFLGALLSQLRKPRAEGVLE
jgi:hypothetical protein